MEVSGHLRLVGGTAASTGPGTVNGVPTLLELKRRRRDARRALLAVISIAQAGLAGGTEGLEMAVWAIDEQLRPILRDLCRSKLQ